MSNTNVPQPAELYKVKVMNVVHNKLQLRPYVDLLEAWKQENYTNSKAAKAKIDALFGAEHQQNTLDTNLNIKVTSKRYELLREVHLQFLKDYRDGSVALQNISFSVQEREVRPPDQHKKSGRGELWMFNTNPRTGKITIFELKVNPILVDIKRCAPPRSWRPSFHRVDYSIISKGEGGQHLQSYIIKGKAGSGNTVGTGVDVGVSNAVNDLYRYFLQANPNPQTCSLYWRFYGFTLQVGDKARELHAKGYFIDLSKEEADFLDASVFYDHMIRYTRSQGGISESEFRKLPAEAQTLLADLIYQFGIGFHQQYTWGAQTKTILLKQDWHGLKTLLKGVLGGKLDRTSIRMGLLDQLIAHHACDTANPQGCDWSKDTHQPEGSAPDAYDPEPPQMEIAGQEVQYVEEETMERFWGKKVDPQLILRDRRAVTLNGLQLQPNEMIWVCEKGELVLWSGNLTDPIRYVDRSGVARTYFESEADAYEAKLRAWMKGKKKIKSMPMYYPIPENPLNNY